MGVYIFMDILPNKIDKGEWERVYEESLELINAYPFLDTIVDKGTYGIVWNYADRTKEKEMEFGYNELSLGWHVAGDLETMLRAESFRMFRNIGNYRNRGSVREGSNDILAMLINREVYDDREEHEVPVGNVTLFDGKTQGFAHHIYLLAIACLIESRFPEQATVSGDISIGQMQKAIKWANTILHEPITLTERIDNEKLLQRIRNIVADDYIALKSFMSLTMHKKDFHLGEFVRGHFSPEHITTYFTEKFKQYNVEMMGFYSYLSDFLNLGFSIEKACDICVLDSDGCQYDATIFAEAVLSMAWEGDEANETIPLGINEPDSENPETVHSQFGKAFLKMAGMQEMMNASMSYKEVGTLLERKLGQVVDIEFLLATEKLGKQRKDEDSLSELLSRFTDEGDDVIETYTIYDLDDLILWEEGDSIDPSIEGGIQQLKDFIMIDMKRNTDVIDRFQNLSGHEQMQMLIKANRFFPIRKETWDYYIENTNDINMMNAIFSILSIKAEEVTINNLCKAVMNNVDLLKKYIL